MEGASCPLMPIQNPKTRAIAWSPAFFRSAKQKLMLFVNRLQFSPFEHFEQFQPGFRKGGFDSHFRKSRYHLY